MITNMLAACAFVVGLAFACAWADTGNAIIWQKDVGQGVRVVVEQANVMEIANGSGLPYFQFTFWLESTKGSSGRELRWVREGWETGLSAPLSHPEVEMLDAAMDAHGFLVVLFNQYGCSWGYRVGRLVGGRWITHPNEGKGMPERVGQMGKGMLTRPPLRTGTISGSPPDDLVVSGVRGDSEPATFRLAEDQNKWEAVPATTQPAGDKSHDELKGD